MYFMIKEGRSFLKVLIFCILFCSFTEYVFSNIGSVVAEKSVDTSQSFINVKSIYYQKLNAYKLEDNKEKIAYCTYEIAEIDQLQGRNDSALKKLNVAHDLYVELKDSLGVANCLSQLGSIYRYRGSYEKAMDSYMKAIDVFKKEKDTLGELKVLNNLGILYRTLGENEKAKAHYFESERLALLIKSDHLATTNNSLGSFYWFAGNNDSALYYYRKALTFNPVNLSLKERKCAVLNNIGNVYRSQTSYDSAIYYYHKSLELSTNYSLINLSAITLKNLGRTYFQKKEIVKSLEYLNESEVLAKKSNVVRVLIEVYRLQSEIFEHVKNYKKSLDKFKLYEALKDSVNSHHRMNRIAELEVSYEVQQMEKNQAILKKGLIEKDLEIVKNRNLIYLYIFIIALLSVISLFVYQRYKTHKRTKNKLVQINDELEIRVAARTRSLQEEIDEHKRTESQLVQAKDKAEESDRLKSAFLANMSHEIRTPMNAIVGFSSLLNTQIKPENVASEYIKLIQSNSDKLLRIIEDIIDLSRIEANHIKLEIEACNIDEIIKELYDTFKPQAEKKRLSLIVTKPELVDELFLETDPYRFTQILSNLINNAIKFTEYGLVEFGYKILDSEIEFFVTDTGIGISEEDQKYVFNRFRQVESSKKIYGGTGLGLSICKELVSLLKGRIGLQSKPGKGSTFSFALPNNTIEPLQNIETEKEPKTYNWMGKRILIVDDDKDCALLLSNILSKTKVGIMFANTGFEAVEIVEKNHFDVILMDLLMPELNGLEAIALIKDVKPEIKIIVQTAYAMPSDKQKSIAAGCDGFITKPIDEMLLLEKINELISE